MRYIKQNGVEKKIILPWWPIARHKPLSLFLMAVGGDKTNCVSVSRLKHCTECRIQEAETVGGNIDDWDLSAWNTKKHPTLYNCLKMNSNLKRRSREEDGEPLKKLGCSDPADTGKLCVYLLQELSCGSWQIRILRISNSVLVLVFICIPVIKLLDTK